MGHMPNKSVLEVWTTGWHWRERIINFTPSWFTVTMGTGIVTQLLVNFPYPAQWLRNLGYCIWILNICLFCIFTVFLVLRYIWYPALMKATLEDFSQSNFLGAIPMGFDTIIVGLISYYNYRPEAVWVAYVFFWISTAMTMCVSLGAVFVMFTHQDNHKLEAVTGVWLLSFVPLIVNSATGAALLPYLNYPNNILTLVVCFLMWSAGQCTSFMVLTIYMWRLMACNVPARDAIVSCFIPLGPLGQGSFSIQQQAVFLANFLKKTSYAPTQSDPPPVPPETIRALAEAVHWMGIIAGLFLIGHATFWLVEAFTSVIWRIPKKFNIGFWGFTFPFGTYANALSFVSKDLRNAGFKGWAATCTTAVVLLWLMCAVGTTYKGFWKGELFYAPGLEGWVYEHGHERKGAGSEEKKENDAQQAHSAADPSQRGQQDTPLAKMQRRQRLTNASGTYSVQRPRSDDEESRAPARETVNGGTDASAGDHPGLPDARGGASGPAHHRAG